MLSRRAFFVWTGAAASMLAEKTPTDYPARTALSQDVTLAAEFLARSVPVSTATGMLFAENHLVVEVAFFGPAGRVFALNPEHFTLTVQTKKTETLPPDSPGAVAGSMRDSMWNAQKPHLEAGGSVGNAGVVLGRPRPTIGAPDIDGRTNRRGPQQPRVSTNEGREAQPLDLQGEINQVSLVRSERKLPVSGLLYFAFPGKLKSIRNLTLHYLPTNASLKLQ